MYGIIRLWAIIQLLLLSLVTIVILAVGGAFRTVDSSMIFDIEGFEEFHELHPEEKCDVYIMSGKLDFCKKEGVYLIPFIKEAGHDDSVILLQPYSETPDTVVKIGEVILATPEGEVISYTQEYGEAIAETKWDSTMLLIAYVEETEEWFYNPNELFLHIRASVKKGDEWIPIEVSYKVKLRRTKVPALQV